MTSKIFIQRFHLKDFLSGAVVFLVALPLCLGIALASGAPIISGIIAGIVGGILVGFLSDSHISVAGPAAGLTAVILVQLELLGGNYAAFLLSVMLAGLIQIVFGLFKLGFFANFIPNNVILGLLAAIGLILIFSQIPYLLGLSNFSWNALVQQNNLNLQWDKGAALIGVVSLGLMLLWDQTPLKKWILPSALLAVVCAVIINALWVIMRSTWAIDSANLIQLPNLWDNPQSALILPDWTALNNPLIYTGAITLAVVASLETLLNLEAAINLIHKNVLRRQIENCGHKA